MLRSRMLRPFRDGRVLFAVPPYANAGAPDGPRFPKGPRAEDGVGRRADIEESQQRVSAVAIPEYR